jgi:hypothetical protein
VVVPLIFSSRKFSNLVTRRQLSWQTKFILACYKERTMSFEKGVSERILEGKRDMEALLARQPPADAPAPDSYGAVFTDKTLDRLRWVVPGLCIFFGLVTLLSIPHTNESAPVGLITLAWMALWIIYGLVSGSERLEVNRLTYTLTVTRYRP